MVLFFRKYSKMNLHGVIEEYIDSKTLYKKFKNQEGFYIKKSGNIRKWAKFSYFLGEK